MSVFRFGLAGSLLCAVSALAAPEPSPLPHGRGSVQPKALDRSPLRFEAVSETRWLARGVGFSVGIHETGAILAHGGRALQIAFAGADASPRFEGSQRSATPTNYFHGGEFRSAAAFLELRRLGLYPGIDVRYYGTGSAIEYDFELAPGADPSAIRIRFDGADRVRLVADGSLAIEVAGKTVTQRAPVVYQRTAPGEIQAVTSHYFAEDGGTYSIRLGTYDPSAGLVIDPEVLFTAYLAGTGADAPLSIGQDANGSIYIAGYTYSDDFPLVGEAFSGFVLTPNQQVFTTKMNPLSTGDDVITYSGIFGGDFGDILRAMAVDAEGVMYMTGMTDDFFFPVTEGAYRKENGSVRRAFFSALDTKLPGKSGLVYSTFFGGSTRDEPTAIAIHDGKAYVTGITTSEDYPVKAAIQGEYKGGIDGWVAEFDPRLSGEASLLHSTYFGGFTQDMPRSIDVDADGKVYIGGYTYSADFPTTPNSHKPFYSGGSDAFLAKLNLDAQAIEYSTFLGGTGIDQAWKILVDPRNGLVALTGLTLSNDFPVTANAMQAAARGNGDTFLTILDLTADEFNLSLIYSTYFGGRDGDVAYDMRLGPSGAYYLSGYTLSRDFPSRDAIRGASGGGSTDGFVAVIHPDEPPAEALQFSTFITGGGFQVATNLEVDSVGNVYVTGHAFGNVFEPGQAQPPDDSNINVFLLVFRPSIPVVRQQATEGIRGAESRRR